MDHRTPPLLTVAVAAVAIALAGCEPAQASDSPEVDEVRLSGSIYTDFQVDSPCDDQQPPPELTGVQISFQDATGNLLGTAMTGPPAHLELPKSPGKETWLHGGCRMFARYAVVLPLADRYLVEFTPRPVPRPADRPYFQGVDLIEPHTATMADLASRDFQWNFEAPAAFVVP